MSNGASLTRDEAIAIQATQLAEWQELLAPKAFAYLKRWAEETNDQPDAFKIRRGLELTRRVEGMALALAVNWLLPMGGTGLDKPGKASR